MLRKEELELVGTMLRKLWLRRNELLFENTFQSPSRLIWYARAVLEKFQKAQKNDTTEEGNGAAI